MSETLMQRLNEFTVLVVEDEPIVLELLINMLKHHCSRIYGASNGNEGLKAFEEHKPDIIITDIMMPVMDGIVMLKEIRRIDQECMSIVLSAFSDSRQLKRAIDVGVDEYVTKPFDKEVFQTAVKRVLNRLCEKKDNDKTLKQTQDLLLAQARQTAINEFYQIVIHQWKEPLARLSENLSLTNAKYQTCEEALSGVNDGIVELMKTIDIYSDYLAEESQQRSCDAACIIERVSLLVKSRIDAMSVLFALDNSSTQTMETFDKEVIQVILHLINSALNSDTMNRVSSPKLTLSANDGKEVVVFTVSDNFTTRCRDIDTSVSDTTPTSLDFRVCKVITEKQLHGRLNFDWNGEGCSFNLTIPCKAGK